jgi:predicted transcriptional regulator
VKGGITFMKTISVRLSDEEKEAFDNCCKELDLSMSHIMRKLIKDFIANNTKEDAELD